MTGYELRACLTDLKWSQAELARRMKVHPNTVTGWTSDRTKIPGSVELSVTLMLKLQELIEAKP